ncbi:hypothetical protein H5410_064713 [Solanum commersonii]|uniref:Uncharacterized protein n=1 Tax=Solanum commersonii TaxID=4109 RepID=A0A9J5VYL6_SOLCO|nr:hypothetical protein H5410_064713 [Solanum commersonii]
MKSRLEVNLYKPLDVEKERSLVSSLAKGRGKKNHVDEILSLTLKDRFVDGAPPNEALTSFEMGGDILKSCKGEMPYPYGESGMEQKNLQVMNIKNTHFIALEFLMEKGLIQYFVFLLSTTLIVSTTASIVPISASVVRTTSSIVPTTTSVVRTTSSIVSRTSLVVPATGLVVPPIL